MPYFKTSQEWLEQSTLLLQASPATTRITTRYGIKARSSKKASDDASKVPAKPPRAELVLKTHDTATGVTLKYRTTKAAEVSRLISASLGRLGRGMAAVPEPPPPEEAMPDAPLREEEEKPAQVPQKAQGGGGKKKKKGKK